MENSRRIFSRYELKFLIIVLYILSIGIINIFLIDTLVQFYKYIFGIPNLLVLVCFEIYYHKTVKEIRKNKYVEMVEDI